MPEMPDVVATEPVESSWGNQIRDRTVQRYADSTERDSLVPLPIAGDTAWLDTEQQLTVFDGAAWIEGYLPLAGGTMTGPVTSQPGGRILIPAPGGVMTRWNGDLNDDTGRYYEWRRAADFGILELWAFEGGTGTLALSVNGAGVVTIPNQQPLQRSITGSVHQVFQDAPVGTWGTIVSQPFTPPAHWLTYTIMLTGGIGQAAMTAGSQIHARCRWAGGVGPATASGNSGAEGARDITTTQHQNGSGTAVVTMDLQGQVVGGPENGVTKYGWLSWVATQVT